MKGLTHRATTEGFTLIEMMVSVAIFAIVMVIALGSLLAMSESDRKAETLKAVINNLNFSIDSMSRSIRTGTVYHCDTAQLPLTSPRDCAGTPATSFSYQPAVGNAVVYRLETSNAALCGQPSGPVGCIVRSTDGGATYSSMTSSEVYIGTLKFYVTGAQNAAIQPKVTILLSGVVTVTATQTSTFNLQTSVTQRIYDQ
jgi:prepilin-type N-terminal cleavage/methylation domain-containing protein